MALPLREVLGLPPSRAQKALTASTTVLEAAQDGTLNLNTKLAVQQGVRAAWMQFQNAGYGYMYGHQPAVRGVVDYIATNVVELGPKLYRRKGDDARVEVGDHPAAETLREPNPWTPGRQFIFDIFADFLVFNNAYALKLKPEGSDRMYLLGIPASAVGVLGMGVYQLAGYQIFRSDGSNFTVQASDMIHWRGYDAMERRMGISKLETLRSELSEQAASQRANVDLMESGLQQRGYIKRPLEAPDWRKDGGKDRFIEQFRAAMKRADRGYPVLEEGMEIAPLGVSPKDAEMLQSRQLFNDEVANQYGMVHCPPEGEEERRQFYADVLPPLCSLFCDFMKLQYLQSEFMEDDLYFEFSIDKKQMSDNRLQALTSAAGVPPLLRNEARGMLNLPPVKGGDEPVTPANVLSGTKPSTGVMPIQNPTGPSQTGEYRTQPGPPAPAPPQKTLGPGGEEIDMVCRGDHVYSEAYGWVDVLETDVDDKGSVMVHIKDQLGSAFRVPLFGEVGLKYDPHQPRGEHTGRWIKKPGGGISLPSAPETPSISGSEPPDWSGDSQWRAASEPEWVSAPARVGGINESGPPGERARAEHAKLMAKWEAENRAALAKRNPDMDVVAMSNGAGFELRPKKGNKLPKDELKKRNPNYQPQDNSIIHRIEADVGGTMWVSAKPTKESLAHRIGDVMKSPFLSDADLNAREKDRFAWQHGQPVEVLDQYAQLGGLRKPGGMFVRNRDYRRAVEKGRERHAAGSELPPLPPIDTPTPPWPPKSPEGRTLTPEEAAQAVAAGRNPQFIGTVPGVASRRHPDATGNLASDLENLGLGESAGGVTHESDGTFTVGKRTGLTAEQAATAVSPDPHYISSPVTPDANGSTLLAFGHYLRSHGLNETQMTPAQRAEFLKKFEQAYPYHSFGEMGQELGAEADKARAAAKRFLDHHFGGKRKLSPKEEAQAVAEIDQLTSRMVEFPLNDPRREPLKREIEKRQALIGRRAGLDEWETKRLEVTTSPRAQADVARQRRNIDEAKGVLEGFYRRQARSLDKGALIGKPFDSDRWNRELADDLVPLFRSIIEREGGVYTARLGGNDFDMRQVDNYIKATAEKLAERINDTTKRDIEAGNAKDALERAQEQRAAVAGTGIGTKATIFARREAADQAPDKGRRTQTWVADTDRHKHLDGVTVSLGDDWDGIEPGSEPNCACTAIIE